jgi:hypothetical protein
MKSSSAPNKYTMMIMMMIKQLTREEAENYVPDLLWGLRLDL